MLKYFYICLLHAYISQCFKMYKKNKEIKSSPFFPKSKQKFSQWEIFQGSTEVVSSCSVRTISMPLQTDQSPQRQGVIQGREVTNVQMVHRCYFQEMSDDNNIVSLFLYCKNCKPKQLQSLTFYLSFFKTTSHSIGPLILMHFPFIQNSK